METRQRGIPTHEYGHWQIHFEAPVFLAPMAGVTDTAYRIIAHDMGCPLCYAEMVSSQGIHFRNEADTHHVAAIRAGRTATRDADLPIPRLWRLRLPATSRHWGRQISWILTGCPAPKIVKNGEGSALMLAPTRSMRSCRQSVRPSACHSRSRCARGGMMRMSMS